MVLHQNQIAMKTLTINLPDNLGIEEFEAKMLLADLEHATR